MVADTEFRVIIVGAGPVGLYLAHALAAANIDFLVIEQQSSVLNYSGALIFTWPQSVRLLDQIGVMKQVQDASVHINAKARVFGQDGTIITISRFWELMRENHGYPFLPLLRSDLVRILYESLPGRNTKVVTSAEVVDITLSGTDAHVHLKNGKVYTGSVVVGADGVHSSTRAIMQRLAGDDTGNPMLTSFRGLLGRAPNKDKKLRLGEGVFFESRGGLAAVQCSAAGDTIYFATLMPVPGGKPMQMRRRYTPEEMEEHAAALADVWVAPGLQFRDLWAAADKDKTRMLNQEEGFLEGAWNHRRIVLLGDAVHKTTSINGLGLTNGLHSAAVLANELKNLVSSELHVGEASVVQAFERYQQQRLGETKEICTRGWNMIREITQSSWISRLWDFYILPWVDSESALRGLVVSLMLVRYGQVLSFIPFDGMHGRVSWLKRPEAPKEKAD
ncbi:FAD binding domain-containing protein [Colletotrichum plurivorum]|uniref:FAD binding domain-containing protein n=1 Tax=Colletotrichum plurivorum TaxID=2175906 RepID=A0A8H6KEI5_9PEZI|nr:FAD binding domain-containing protein [Colletotrichum plurivorum]